MNVEKELNEIVNAVLADRSGIFLVETGRQQDNYEIVIDGDKPLGIYDISDISREINKIADERMPDEKYSLDICSPGADSDLRLIRQYPKHIGREFNLTLNDDTSMKGKLLAVENEILTFEAFKNPKPKRNEVPEIVKVKYSEIKKANIILSFK